MKTIMEVVSHFKIHGFPENQREETSHRFQSSRFCCEQKTSWRAWGLKCSAACECSTNTYLCVVLSVRGRPRPVLWPHEAVWGGRITGVHTLPVPGGLRGQRLLQYRSECCHFLCSILAPQMKWAALLTVASLEKKNLFIYIINDWLWAQTKPSSGVASLMVLHTVNATQNRERIFFIKLVLLLSLLSLTLLFLKMWSIVLFHNCFGICTVFFLLSSAALINKTYLNGVCGAGPVMILGLTDVHEM